MLLEGLLFGELTCSLIGKQRFMKSLWHVDLIAMNGEGRVGLGHALKPCILSRYEWVWDMPSDFVFFLNVDFILQGTVGHANEN